MGSENPKNGRAKLTNPFLCFSKSFLPSMICVFELRDNWGIVCHHYLVQFEANETSNQRRCGGNGRDDLAGNLFSFMSISRLDTIVHRPEIGCRCDEIYVMIGVVVLFKLHRVQPETCQRRGSWERRD